jgi:hypothetical protein
MFSAHQGETEKSHAIFFIKQKESDNNGEIVSR